MRRRRNTRYVIGFFVIWLCFGVAGFLVGYYFSSERGGDPPFHVVEEEPNENQSTDHTNSEINLGEPTNDDRQVTSQGIVISEDTNLVFRTRYNKCQTIVDEKIPPLNDMIGLNKQEFDSFLMDNFQGWDQVQFSRDEVIVLQNKDEFCPGHYWVSQIDGYVAIYQFDGNGNLKLVEKTRIPIAVRNQVDQEKLKNGFPLPTWEDVEKLKEDYDG